MYNGEDSQRRGKIIRSIRLAALASRHHPITDESVHTPILLQGLTTPQEVSLATITEYTDTINITCLLSMYDRY
jgi:hypothetical protein